jgi:protein TonB
MPVKSSVEEPAVPLRLQRPLAAVWISLALHAALIALVQVAPPASSGLGEPVIEARLVSRHADPPIAEPPPLTPEVEVPAPPPEKTVSLLASSETADALPVAAPLPAQSAPPAAPAPQPASPPAASPPTDPAPVPAVTITSSVDLTYYSARDLDVQPRALRNIEPAYPVEADRQRRSGKLRLQLKLEADGRVSDIEVVSADPPDVFNDSAISAFRDARFAPAQRNGRPVRARVLIEVVYDWEGRR